jgi:hypothetical protein
LAKIQEAKLFWQGGTMRVRCGAAAFMVSPGPVSFKMGRYMLRIACVGLLALANGISARAAETSGASGQDPVATGPSPLIQQWRPLKDGKDLRLQDFCIFEYQGKTLITSMMKDFCYQGIALAGSGDLAHWEARGTALETRTAEDQSMVWAPHVVASKGIYYMFYTGVNTPSSGQWCQRILLASSPTPDDPWSWKRRNDVGFIVNGKVQDWFRPTHAGSVWNNNAWADCRDPMVLEIGGTWHLFYTGRDEGFGVCGVATAPSVLGPWTDHGAVLKVANPTIPESCFVLADPDGGFVMVFNHAAGGGGSTVARSSSVLPLNGQPPFANLEALDRSAKPGLKGWAHEFLPHRGKEVLAAYLTGYFITFEPAQLIKTGQGWTVAPRVTE